MHIYVDRTLISYNDRKAFPVLSNMEQSGEYTIVHGESPLNDPRVLECEIVATNSRVNAEKLSDLHPNKLIYLIENPINKGYKSLRKNLIVVWCWDDFQFFVYFPRKSNVEDI